MGGSPTNQNAVKDVSNFNFANGSSLSLNQLLQRGITVINSADNQWIDRSSLSDNETITTSGANDAILLGSGNDSTSVTGNNSTIYSGTGVDSFHYLQGTGLQTINEYATPTTSANTDSLSFGSGISSNSITLTSTGGSDLSLVAGSGDQVTINNETDPYAAKVISSFSFADGTELTLNQLLQRGITVINATDNQWIDRTSMSDNETIATSGANDYILLGSGNDTTTVSGDNSTIYSGTGNDNYDFEQGTGLQTINEYATPSSSLSTDSLNFGTGISSSNVMLTSTGGSDLSLVAGNGDQVTINNETNPSAPKTISCFDFAGGTDLTVNQLLQRGITVINSTDNQWIDRTSMSDNETIETSGANDYILLGSGNDSTAITGNNSTIYSGTGNDSFDYNQGSGVQTISEYATPSSSFNTDALRFGAGISSSNVTLTSTGGSDLSLVVDGNDEVTINNETNPSAAKVISSFSFADGSDLTLNQLLERGIAVNNSSNNQWIDRTSMSDNETITTSGANDSILAGSGNDTIVSSGNNSTVYSGSGSDNFEFNQGSGLQTINEYGSSSNTDTLSFGPGISASDVALSSTGGSDLSLNLANGDEVTINNETNTYASKNVSTFDFANGSSLTLNQLLEKGITVANSADNQWIDRSSMSDNETITTSGSNDSILAGSGNDTISASGNNATINSGSGSDTIDYNSGTGLQTINEYASPTSSSNTDTIDLGAGISENTVSLSSTGGSDLTLNLGNGDELTINNETNPNAAKVVSSFDFADGTSLSLSQLLAKGVSVNNSSDNQWIDRSSLTDNETITTSGNSDSILAGSGNDTINTSGSNTNIYAGRGTETINASGSNSTINAGSGVETINASGSSATVRDGSGSNTVHASAANSNVTGGSGTSLVTLSGNNSTFTGTSGTDTVTASGSNSTVNAGSGSSSITAVGNNDTVGLSNSGTGTISATGSNDNIQFGQAVAKDTIAFFMNGSNLEIGYTNNQNSEYTVDNQAGSNPAISSLTLADGENLSSSDVNLIIQQMTSFAANNPGVSFNNLSDVENSTALMNIIASSWHH